MKSYLSVVSALILSVIAFGPFLADLPAATIAHWDFEDGVDGVAFSAMPAQGSVDIANGIVMFGYDSTWGPAFSSDTLDGFGLCSRHNGSQDGYTVDAAINAWSPVTWTIEISAKLDHMSGWQTLIGRDGSSFSTQESDFYLQKNSVDGAFRLNMAAVDGSRYILDSSLVPEAGRWYRLVLTSDGTVITMYVDALDGAGYQVVGSLTMTGATPADNALAATNYNWTFGRGWFNGSFTDRITGNLDNVRFSDVVLSPEQFLGYSPVRITQTDGRTLLFAGDTGYTDSYDIVLNRQPAADVMITVTPPPGLSVGAGSGEPRVLTFTHLNWDQPQTVTVAIADPSAVFNPVEFISQTVQSADPAFAVTLRSVEVEIAEEVCGAWGYLESDVNCDCRVNLEDFASFADVWLRTESPLDLQPFAQDWLLETLSYDPALSARSIQETSRPFTINPSNVLNPIDEKIYGHFFEHIYHSANGGLWGEMVWNRSFEINGSGTALWSIDGDALVQSSLATDIHMEFGDPSWTDYEMTLQARKDKGNEGFLILFRAVDSDNFYWANLGGWENTRHAIEKEIDGSRSTIGVSANGSIPTGQWVDIRIRCEGNRFRVWLDESTNPDPILDVTNNSRPFLTGRVGLGTWATAARFRNIQVTQIPGSTVLYSGLPALPGTAFNASYWTFFGDGEAAMQTDALNDDFSVRIVANGTPTGLVQDNFAFIPQLYTGSLWMKGSMPAGVKVELLDDTTVIGQATLPAPTSTWAEYPFQIEASAATDLGRLHITCLGAGSVYLDQVSLMGRDAIDTGGYRPDLLQAVEGLTPPIIRWPGGCFASLYLWKDGIGPQHTRRRYAAVMWEDQDTNSYGTDEFLRMCEQIGSEPLICVNTGVLNSACGAPAQWKLSPDTTETYLQYALDWMEYCNGDAATTTWGAVRAANGHPEPYNVTYWEIDNETWAAGSSAYIARVLEFAPAMRAKAAELGVPIVLIAVGGSGYDQGWNRDIIDNCAALIDFISVHYYESPDGFKSGPDNYENYLITLADYIANSANPDMKIYNSEWNAQSTDWRTGLFAGGILNVYERQGEAFRIGGPALFLRHTSAGDWDNAFINFDHTGWFPAPNYVVMKLWRDRYEPWCIETTGDDTDLNVTTAMSDDGRTLQVRIVNPDAADKSLRFDLDPSFVPARAYLHFVAPGSLYARNTLADPAAVRVEAKVVSIDGQSLRLIMPGYSTGVITVEARQP